MPKPPSQPHERNQAFHFLAFNESTFSYSDATYSEEVSFPTVTFTEKYSRLPLRVVPYSANSAAVIVALPSGRLVGTEIFAVMFPMMLEFAVEEKRICTRQSS